MHKIFAKPLFLGKKVVFLPQCHSTNDELVGLAKNFNEPEGLVVYTDNQIKGKGQRGNVWLAEPGKNILMSVLLRSNFLSAKDQFYLNLITGLALIDLLRKYEHHDLALKWPNDVYLNKKKVAGVLIESNMRGSTLETSVVGVGLNVNQQGFGMDQAISLYMVSGEEHDRIELMDQFLSNLEQWYLKLKAGHKSSILNAYHHSMMWRGELHVFETDGRQFEGEIVGIDANGKLSISDGDKLFTFGIKEVKFIS